MFSSALSTDRNMICSILLFLTSLLALTGLSVQQQASFVEEPQNATVREGDTVTLRCVLDRAVSMCSWLRAGGAFAMGDRYNYSANTNGGLNSRDCSIDIVRFTAQYDGAAWQCVIMGGSNTKTVTSTAAFLIPLVRPSNPTIHLNGNPVTQLSYPMPQRQPPGGGGSGRQELSCVSAGGNPAAELRWDLDGRPLASPKPFVTEAVRSSSTGDRTPPPLYDAVLRYDLEGDGARLLQNGKLLRCVATHPEFPAALVATVAITHDSATTNVRAFVEGSNESTLEVDAEQRVTLICHGNGRPVPQYEWQYRPEWQQQDGGDAASSAEWVTLGDVQNVTVVGRSGSFRCLAFNQLNALHDRPYTQEIVLRVKTVEEAGLGAVVFIVIGCAVVVLLVLLVLLFLYRRKCWIFAVKDVDTSVDKDVEVANGNEGDKPDEKTALSQESQYENVVGVMNGKDEEANGKKMPPDSPLKSDQNANKQPGEILYAQLDLVKSTTTAASTTPNSIKSSPEYEKTEYAEIRFNNKENQV